MNLEEILHQGKWNTSEKLNFSCSFSLGNTNILDGSKSWKILAQVEGTADLNVFVSNNFDNITMTNSWAPFLNYFDWITRYLGGWGCRQPPTKIFAKHNWRHEFRVAYGYKFVIFQVLYFKKSTRYELKF